MTDSSYPRGTEEYVAATVTADVDLTSQAVDISINRSNEAHSWLAAEWVGDEGTTRKARTADPVTFDVDTYPEDAYTVWVRVSDSPETPIMAAGRITIG